MRLLSLFELMTRYQRILTLCIVHTQKYRSLQLTRAPFGGWLAAHSGSIHLEINAHYAEVAPDKYCSTHLCMKEVREKIHFNRMQH